MRVAPEKCSVVENAPYGVRAARNAGCRVAALCTTLEPGDLQPADWIVRDHYELYSLLLPVKAPAIICAKQES